CLVYYPCSQVQSTLSSSFGDRGNATGVAAAAAVKDDRVNASLLGTLGDEFANLTRFGSLVGGETAKVCLHGRSGCQGETLAVINDLNEYVSSRTRDHETWTSFGADNLLAESGVTTNACRRLTLASNTCSHGLLTSLSGLAAN